MQSETISFTGAAGATLAGTLRRPDGPVRGSALLAHCFTCSKDIPTTARLARRLTEGGWVTLTFDFTGLGDSEGDFSATTVRTEVGDVVQAAVSLIERNAGPCVLIGHSLGGAAAVLAAARLHTVTSLVCVAAPADVAHVAHLFGPDVPTEGDIDVHIGGRPFTIGADFRTDLETHNVEEAASRLEIPVLVVEAGADTIVGPEQTARLAAAARADVRRVPDADHLFSVPDHSDQLAAHVIDWLLGAAP